MKRVRAIEVSVDGRFDLVTVPKPEPKEGLATVRVIATSLNRGEVNRARQFGVGFRPGWDIAGVVEEAAASGPAMGERVAGYVFSGGWAEFVTVPPSSLAVIPDEIDFETAACLPIAGLTALGAIERAGSLLGRRVLVTGASGGVGSFAVNLAGIAGADVTAVVRSTPQSYQAQLPGAARIISSESGLVTALRNSTFDLIVETLGGPSLSDSMTMLTPDGLCVSVGVTDSTETTFDAERFFMQGGASLTSYVLMRDRTGTTIAERLGRLLHLVAIDRLPVEIRVVENWELAEEVADRLMQRGFAGKAVLRIG